LQQDAGNKQVSAHGNLSSTALADHGFEASRKSRIAATRYWRMNGSRKRKDLPEEVPV
jgi:hypothetical protein